MPDIGSVFRWLGFVFPDRDDADIRNKLLVFVALPNDECSDYLFLLTTSKEYVRRQASPGTRCANGTSKGYKFEVADQPKPWFTLPTWINFNKVYRVDAETLRKKISEGIAKTEFRIAKPHFVEMQTCFMFAKIDTAADDFSRIESAGY